MLLFTWHELVLFHDRPAAPDPSRGQTIAATTRVFGDTDPFYLSQFDVAVRMGLAALVLGLALWAVLSTFRARQGGAQPE